MQSHLQTRNIVDALNQVDEILGQRATCLKKSQERSELSQCFAVKPFPDFFSSWAFSAAEYNETIAVIRRHAPELCDCLIEPDSERDFSVVGHCSLEALFSCDPNGTYEESHSLADGTKVEGATIIGSEICLYMNGLLRIPTETSGFVYFYQPTESVNMQAAELAVDSLKQAGDEVCRGIDLTFPKARTSQLPAYEWIKGMESDDGLYRVANFVHSGESFVDHNGFFAKETNIVQMEFLCEMEARRKVVINDPFMVFFVDDSGVHAASWFDRDSFILK